MKLKEGAKKTLSIWKDVFGNWRYVLLAVMIMISFYLLNVFITDYGNLKSVYSYAGIMGVLEIFPVFILHFRDLMLTGSFLTFMIITFLLGMLFSLITYKTKMLKTASGKTGLLSSAGIFLGILVPGCAACGIGLVSVLGLSAAFLSFLPFNGLELSILSIGILGISIRKITKDLSKPNVCEVNINKLKGGKR